MDKKLPSSLSYGVVPSAPASIQPVDIDKWKGKIEPEFRNYFETKYKELVRQYNDLVEEFEINRLMYESKINLQPVIGKIYHLYERKDGTRWISLLSYTDTRWEGYIGSFRLKSQYTWERVDIDKEL